MLFELNSVVLAFHPNARRLFLKRIAYPALKLGEGKRTGFRP